MVQTYYNYISILAFFNLYRYENKKELSIQNLHKYQNQLIIEYNNHIHSNNLQESPLSITFNNKEYLLNNFLTKYHYYFYFKDNKICLKNNITYTQLLMELEYPIREENEISNTIIIISDHPELKKILNIQTMDKLLLNYSIIEKKLEDTYNKLYTKDDNIKLRKEIKRLMDLKANFYIQLGLIPKYALEAFRLSAGDITYPNEPALKYQTYPMDKSLWKALPKYNEEYNYDIDDYAHNMYQYALFGQNNIYPSKIFEDIESFQFKQNMEEEIKEQFNNGVLEIETEDEIINSDNDNWSLESLQCGTEQEIFYLNYLNNLNYFLSIYDYNENLIHTKVRLMYAIDNPELRIYDDNNFKKEMEDLVDLQFNSIDWDYLQNIVYFFIHELFLKPSNNLTVQKLLYIKTYYDLTKDNDLIDEIDKYQHDPRYELFSSILLNDRASNKTIIEQGKKYFKQLNKKFKKDQ